MENQYECNRVQNDYYIRLSGKCLSFTDTSFITMHPCTNMKSILSNVVIFILIEPNGSYVIWWNNIKRRMLCIHYFLMKRKKLFGRPNNWTLTTQFITFTYKINLKQKRNAKSILFITVNSFVRSLQDTSPLP